MVVQLSEDKCLPLPSQTGTYCLVFYCSILSQVTVGKLGIYQIVPGYYCYIGSAFGRGGLQSRIERHLKINKRHHWHLDYIRPYLEPIEFCYTTDSIKREHQWSDLFLKEENSSIPINKFGSSDCHCSTHLFYYKVKPKLEKLLSNYPIKILSLSRRHITNRSNFPVTFLLYNDKGTP
ncbi:GIY-YIG nuclease family protein [Crocosphaera chwakensis]|uniref:GIY-YIG domain-containing protein n=1 Tax=Crocosphaera chwakensis CCY0110 TaxID=391612 RepID=A3IUZ6_9CHRO|nr:GIY-YIG nuclease family protein [Crocosphaera chwakensis]EAZ89744.1 hypothetical protein CY0110_23356 [Crocosphaera chwakensis CCY0110]